LEDRLALSLVAAYGFNEGSGTTLGDSSGNNLIGTISGAAWSTAGRFGGALSFDGVNDWVTVADNNLLDLSAGMTFMAWVNLDVASGIRDVLIKEGAGVDIYNLYARNWRGLPESNVLIGGTNRVAEGTALAANTWVHLAGTYDGSVLRYFANGSLVASTNFSGSVPASTGPLRIGGNSLWGEFFDGRIDELRIYNHTLAQSEIQADMNTPVGAPPQDIIAPKIIAVTPLMGATNINPAVNVTVTFTEPMDPATINSSTIDLRDPSGQIVPAVVTFNATNLTATINPDANLASTVGYYAARVKGGPGGVKDLAGNSLTSDVNWAFSTVPLQLQETTAFAGLLAPTVVKFAPDGRVFVAEMFGQIKVFDNLNDSTATVFADLRTQVHGYWDRGLLGMTLHPDFANNPYVYVLYTHDAPIGGTAPHWGSPGVTQDPGPGASGGGSPVSGRLSRLTVRPDGTWDGNELVLVEDWANQYPSHSIGTVAFGPDGYLYASGGDGASFNFADSGQNDDDLSSPIGDPPNEGGATRSQDLRTPNDPTGLDGTVIRIDPNTGLAVPFVSTLIVQGSPSVDANGVQHYSVISAYQGAEATTLRILEPDNPAPGEPQRFIYLLPVTNGLTDLNSEFGDGLEQARILNLHNLYNATLVAPSFNIEPWYGDHASDPDRRLESFVVKDVVPFVDQLAIPGTTPERWAVGFSKSGNGALSLIFRHSNVFSAAAAWDAPAQFTDMSAFPGMGANFGTEENFDNYEIPSLLDQNSGNFLQRNRIWISGDNSAWTAHMQTLHQQMLTEGIVHTFVDGVTRPHHWNSGWLELAVASLDTTSNETPRHDENARRIVSYGFRNPFRFTFRPGTNEVFLGDVGWNVWEEINRISDPYGSVENLGWPAYEGPNRQTGYDNLNVPILENFYAEGPSAHTGPYYAYDHSAQVVPGSSEPTGSSAIAGLAFSQGGNMPAGFDGSLFWTDYNRDTIWVMYRGMDGLPDPNNRAVFYRNVANPLDAVNLEIGPGGLLYFPDLDSGTIRRIQVTGSNQPPTADIDASATSIQPGQTVNFDGTDSTDPEGNPLSYAWDLDGDGAFDDATTAQTSFLHAAAGVYTVGLRVTDSGGLFDTETIQIVVGNAPTAVIDTPQLGTLFQANATLNFTGHANDIEDGALPASALTWTFSYYQAAEEDPNNVNLRNRQVITGVASGQYLLPDWEFPVFLVVELTATDSAGLQHTQSLRIDPQTVTLSFNSNPAGLQLSLNGRTKVAPFTRALVVGSVNQVGASSPQTLNGQTYTFNSWSDGGAAVHFVTAPAAPTTYTASFSGTPIPTGLVAAYGFNEGSGTTLGDSSGNNLNGTIAGAAWNASGKYGSALTFDGINDLVTVADAAALDLTTGMTLEAWVNPSALGGWRNVLIKERPGGEVYNLYASGDASAPQVFIVTGGSPADARGSTQLVLNTWSHVAATYDGSVLRIFVNGAQVGSRNVGGSILTSAGVLRIGGNGIWGEFFAGRIDDVRIYNRALSASEISVDMNTPVGTTLPTLSIGDISVQEGNSGTTNAVFTVTLSSAASQTVTVQYATANGTAQAPGDYATTSGTVTFPAGSTSQTITVPIVGDTALEPNESFTVNLSSPSNAVIADGEATGTIVNDEAGISMADASIQEGSSGTSNLIFTVTLSSSVSQTVTVQYSTGNGTAQSPGDYSATTGTVTFPAGSTSQTIAVPIVGDTATEQNETFVVNLSNPTNAAIADGQATGTILNDDGPANLVAAYGFNEGTGTTLGDSSGNNLNGTITGAAWNTTGRFGSALSFDGVNDWVTIADAAPLDLTTGMTLEAWVNPTALGGWRNVLIKERPGGEVYNLYASGDASAPQVFIVTSGAPVDTRDNAQLALNTWSHLAVTYDGSVLRIFVNGTQEGSRNVNGSILTSAGALRIGGNSVWGEFFSGRIDEIRIYNRALSASEIQADMNAPVGNPLIVEGGIAQAADADSLTANLAAPVISEAIARWQELGATAAQVDALNHLDVKIIDLPHDHVGLATPGVIWLDVDAAGRGWFVDPTPGLDEEFSPILASSPATGKVDLLTAVVHEMGHHLGRDHSDPYGFMQENLATGVRTVALQVPNEPISQQVAHINLFANITSNRDVTEAVVAKNDVSRQPQPRIADLLFGADGWLPLRNQESAIGRRYGSTRPTSLVSNDNDGTDLLNRTTRKRLADDNEVNSWLSKNNALRPSKNGAAFDDVDHVFAELDRGRLIARRLRTVK
jgi:glucose/arabinose dehydrogenase